MLSRLSRMTAVTALSLALLSAFASTAARAELRRLDMQLDGFFTARWRNDITHALDPFADEYDELAITAEKRRVTIVPKKDTRVQIWDIIRQLRNAERVPIRTTVLAVGSLGDYVVSIAPRARLLTRKAFFVPDSGLSFLVNEGELFDEAVHLSEHGTKPIALFGELIAWDEYHLPILLIKAVRAADAEWTDAELERLLSPEVSDEA